MPASPSEAILFVDGYNMIGAWPHLVHLRDREGLETARRELTESLLSYSAAQNFDTQIVFDAQYRDTPGSREVITSYLSVFYTDHRQTPGQRPHLLPPSASPVDDLDSGRQSQRVAQSQSRRWTQKINQRGVSAA